MVLCVRDDDRAIGVVRLSWDGGYVAFLSDVIVIPEYQGQGIGKKLVEAVIKRIKDDMSGYFLTMAVMFSVMQIGKGTKYGTDKY